jgi:transposase
METTLLLPVEFAVLDTCVNEKSITMGLIFTATIGYCPVCHAPSRHLHSHYQRCVRDLSISGKQVTLALCCRKFFCEQENCPRKIFAQQSSNQLKPYAWRLERVNQQVLAIGLEMGSKPGARICGQTGLPISASTILRVVKKAPVREVAPPTVLGVDDFAFRKREAYGTILVDLEKRQPVDLLPDREGETLEKWLTQHPGVAIVSRDRSSVYAHAISQACPEAIQVADRWHLLQNLGENTARYLDMQRTLLKEAALEVSNPPVPPESVTNVATPAVSTPTETIGVAQPLEKRQIVFEQVKQLQTQQYGFKTIARHLGISRNTVRKYFNLQTFVPKTHQRHSNLLEYEAYLRQRWQEGEHCVKLLLKEIKPMGYNGSYTILAQLLSDYPKDTRLNSLPAARKGANLAGRSLSIALCQPAEKWEEKDKPLLTKLLEKSPLLRQLWELNLAFKDMMARKKGEYLENWCESASQHSFFKSFVQGIRQDFEAVRQAMTSQWSNGQTEGQVNRLKNIKRQMYGRASFELLRIRVLARTG